MITGDSIRFYFTKASALATQNSFDNRASNTAIFDIFKRTVLYSKTDALLGVMNRFFPIEELAERERYD